MILFMIWYQSHASSMKICIMCTFYEILIYLNLVKELHSTRGVIAGERARAFQLQVHIWLLTDLNIICFICQTPYMMFTFMIYSFDHCSYLSYLCPVHYNILTVDRWILSYFGCCTVWSFSSQTEIAINGKSSIYYTEKTVPCAVRWCLFEVAYST